MKLLIAVVNRQDYRGLQDALVESGFRFTEIGSTGGFLREGNVTLLIGVEAHQVDSVLAIIREHCHSREQVVHMAPPDTRLYANPIGGAMTVPVGGAQVFVINVERVVHA
jgi:uncharacterized protein YaaQ